MNYSQPIYPYYGVCTITNVFTVFIRKTFKVNTFKSYPNLKAIISSLKWNSLFGDFFMVNIFNSYPKLKAIINSLKWNSLSVVLQYLLI